jgi:parallel beta-helix repeat protein
VAQGNNFGIGLIAAAATGNVVEDNAVVGNSNGIFLAAGVKGNVIRRNLIVGNPPLQVDMDHPLGGGVDIKNLADDGANTFRGNRCLTSINAPCPAVRRNSIPP